MRNKGTRGVVEIVLKHEAQPSALWPRRRVPLLGKCLALWASRSDRTSTAIAFLLYTVHRERMQLQGHSQDLKGGFLARSKMFKTTPTITQNSAYRAAHAYNCVDVYLITHCYFVIMHQIYIHI